MAESGHLHKSADLYPVSTENEAGGLRSRSRNYGKYKNILPLPKTNPFSSVVQPGA
jgi:hypothetical protein